MAKRKSLGRGLSALLSQSAAGVPAPAAGEAETAAEQLRDLPVDLLVRGQYQPRVDMREESLAELAESIRAQGVVQPIVVRPLSKSRGEQEQRYEIIAGERRWRAAQQAGLSTVPTLIRDVPDGVALAIALIENIQRENLNPIEEAMSLQRLVEEFEMTHTDAAQAVGRSRASVSNLLRLLDLPAPVRRLLEARRLDMGHARAILGVTSTEQQVALAQQAAESGWSVRVTEQAVRKLASGTGTPAAGKGQKSRNPDILNLERELGERLGAPVSIDHGPRGGRIVVRYNDLEELEGILGHIR